MGSERRRKEKGTEENSENVRRNEMVFRFCLKRSRKGKVF